MSEGVWLWSYDLVSKWGFNDGDMPENLLDHLDDLGISYGKTEWHPILRRLVREHLLPKIPQQVEVYDIETIHNPIRASSVDGREVDDLGEPEGQIADVDVTVPWGVVVALVTADTTRPADPPAPAAPLP